MLPTYLFADAGLAARALSPAHAGTGPACRGVAASGDWQALEEARQQVLTRLRRTAAGLTELMAARDAAASPTTLKEIEQQYLAPLGL